MRFLILTLEAPLMAFGDEIVDNIGRVREAPGASNLAGLIANALGWTRGMGAAHQRLQDALRFAVRIDRPGRRLTDFQTAKLEANDRGWTTRGVPEGRSGGGATYDSPHIRYRDFLADAALTVALGVEPGMEPAGEAPTLDAIEAALEQPARPLFFGRKPCLPSRPLLSNAPEQRFVEAADAFAAVRQAVAEGIEDGDEHPDGPLLLGPALASLPPAFERRFVADLRNWRAGVHGGGRMHARGRVVHLDAGRSAP